MARSLRRQRLIINSHLRQRSVEPWFEAHFGNTCTSHNSAHPLYLSFAMTIRSGCLKLGAKDPHLIKSAAQHPDVFSSDLDTAVFFLFFFSSVFCIILFWISGLFFVVVFFLGGDCFFLLVTTRCDVSVAR